MSLLLPAMVLFCGLGSQRSSHFGSPRGRLQAQTTGSIEIDFREQSTDQPLNCRVQILNSSGKAQRARGAIYEQGWNLIDGTLRFQGRPGDYVFQAFHGPQFSASSGGFRLDRKSKAVDVAHLPRHADLSNERWFGGDLLSHLGLQRTLPWLPAEDLAMAVAVDSGPETPPMDQLPDTADSGRWVESDCYWDHREGSGLLLHHWWPPAVVPASLPSSRLLIMATDAQPTPGKLPVHVEIQRLWARDVPIWLASGRIHSIQLLTDHLSIDGEKTVRFEPFVDPAPGRFRGPTRSGKIVEQIYWKVLECGLRIPPTAGSGFGRTSSPLGYHRVYVSAPSMTQQNWWQALREGRTFVTSGPLLRTKVNGAVPGKVFAAPPDSTIDVDISLELTVADPVEYLEVIFNGRTLYRAKLDEYAKQGGRIPTQAICESGWMLVRVATANDVTHRIASTAPYYFEIGDSPRISRSAVAFFQDWLELTATQIQRLDEPTTRAAAPYISAARAFWEQRAMSATAD